MWSLLWCASVCNSSAWSSGCVQLVCHVAPESRRRLHGYWAPFVCCGLQSVESLYSFGNICSSSAWSSGSYTALNILKTIGILGPLVFTTDRKVWTCSLVRMNAAGCLELWIKCRCEYVGDCVVLFSGMFSGSQSVESGGVNVREWMFAAAHCQEPRTISCCVRSNAMLLHAHCGLQSVESFYLCASAWSA